MYFFLNLNSLETKLCAGHFSTKWNMERVILFDTLNSDLIRNVLMSAVAEYGYDLRRTYPTNTPLEWLTEYFNRKRPADRQFITPFDCMNRHFHSNLPNTSTVNLSNSCTGPPQMITKTYNSTLVFNASETKRMWDTVMNETKFNEFVKQSKIEYKLLSAANWTLGGLDYAQYTGWPRLGGRETIHWLNSLLRITSHWPPQLRTYAHSKCST
jgi:hypothetical protein